MSSIESLTSWTGARALLIGLATLALEYAAYSVFKVNGGAGVLDLAKAYAVDFMATRTA